MNLRSTCTVLYVKENFNVIYDMYILYTSVYMLVFMLHNKNTLFIFETSNVCVDV